MTITLAGTIWLMVCLYQQKNVWDSLIWSRAGGFTDRTVMIIGPKQLWISRQRLLFSYVSYQERIYLPVCLESAQCRPSVSISGGTRARSLLHDERSCTFVRVHLLLFLGQTLNVWPHCSLMTLRGNSLQAAHLLLCWLRVCHDSWILNDDFVKD